MGYQISYNPEDDHKYPPCQPMKRGKWACWVMVCAVLFGMVGIPKVRSKLEMLLIPGDVQVTKAAFSDMLDQIQTGQPIDEAVSAFCREIIHHGNQEQILET